MLRMNQNYAPKTQALPHQIEAVNFIDNHKEVALFDEQGLGKTKVVIDSLCRSFRNKEIEGALIIAPMTLLYNWELEVAKHSYLIPIVLRGSSKEKRYKFLTGANFYITNYESVIAEIERIKRFCKSRRVAIVLDESARIKDPITKTAQAVFELRPFSEKRIIITGTPVANKPVDIWAQYYFLDGGQLLGPDYKIFKSRLNEKNESYIGYLQELQEIVGANSIRRRKDDVLELPEKIFKNIYVELQGQQLDIYNKLKEELRIEITAMDGSTIIDESDNILKKLLRLTQIASNPWLIDRGYKDTPVKFEELDSIVEGIVDKNEKAIIWTSFVDNILLLKTRFARFNPLVIYGDIPIVERASFVEKFQESDKYKIMIANPAAAREGITLTKANNAIYVDRNFNLVDYLQSQDRIHRISQTKTCTIIKLIAKNTIDEYIDRFVNYKKGIASFVQGDVSSLDSDTSDFLFRKQELLSILGG